MWHDNIPTPKYTHGDIVYLRVDSDANAGTIIYMCIMPGNVWRYGVQWVESVDVFYEFELTDIPVYKVESTANEE